MFINNALPVDRTAEAQAFRRLDAPLSSCYNAADICEKSIDIDIPRVYNIIKEAPGIRFKADAAAL